MDGWFEDQNSYPRIRIDRGGGTGHDRSGRIYERSSSGGNVIRIRVQGRRSMDRDSDSPRISVQTFSSSDQSSPPGYTSPQRQPSQILIDAPGFAKGTPIQVKHFTSAYKGPIGGQIPVSTVHSTNVKGPMKAVPITIQQRTPTTSPESTAKPTQRSFGSHRSFSTPFPASFLDSANIFETFEKEFERFTSESRNYSDRKYGSRRSSQDSNSTEYTDAHESYSSKGHGPEEIRINTTTIRTRNPSSSTEQDSMGSPSSTNPPNFRTEAKFSTSKTPSAIAQAKRILDRVLRDLEEVDSGYSGSGETLAGSTLSSEELKDRIQKFNDNHKTNKITQDKSKEELFQGDIQVNICLEQPVNMVLQTRPVSMFDVVNKKSSSERKDEGIKASVTLPKNTLMGIHINSNDTAEKTIELLLEKFNILEDSKKFSLFEQTLQNEDEVKLRKVASSEKPLLNYLRWKTESTETKRFVLKESDTAEIMWEAFSVPELNNFLRMLEFEQQHHVEIIRNKFAQARKNMEGRLSELTTPNSTLSL